jgi:hypothetical protein
MSPAYEITQSPQEIEHNLGTTDLIVQVWVNGYAVQPDARIENENTVVVGLAQPFGEAKAIIEPATAKPTRAAPAPKESSDADKTRGEGDSSSDEGSGGTSSKGRSRR